MEEALGLGIQLLSGWQLVTHTMLYDGMVLNAQHEIPSLLTVFRKGDLGSAADRCGSRQSKDESQWGSLGQAVA